MKASMGILRAVVIGQLFISLAQAQPDCTFTDAKDPSDEITEKLKKHQDYLKNNIYGERADLRGKDLMNVWVTKEYKELGAADFGEVPLEGADLGDGKFQEANFYRAELPCATLAEANFASATLFAANLSQADLTDTILKDANLSYAVMHGTYLKDTDLDSANFSHVDLTDAFFEPRTLPEIRTLANVEGLGTLRFSHPAALYELREKFRSQGFREQEREITFAIWRIDDKWDGPYQLIKWVLFQFTCEWGRSPLRPLRILFVLMGFLGLIYMFAIITRPAARTRYKTGIYQDWVPESKNPRKPRNSPRRYLHAQNSRPILYGLFFSVISAFNFGWGRLKFDQWLQRLNPEEFSLQANGRLRTVAGAQTLISLYLVVLFLLTYFGRPF